MRANVAVILLLVASTPGCLLLEALSERVTTTYAELSLFDETVAMGPEPMSSARVALELPANITQMQVHVTGMMHSNFRIEGHGCPSSGGTNVQAGFSSSASTTCNFPPAGAYTLVLTRDAGVGDVHVVVTATQRITTYV